MVPVTYTYGDIEELRERIRDVRLEKMKAKYADATRDWLSFSQIEDEVRTCILAGIRAKDIAKIHG